MPGRPLCSVHAALDTEDSAEVAATLYTEDIHDEERRLWHQISVTDLDAEIRVAKLQLKRLLAAQRRLELHDENAADETVPPEKTSKRMAVKPREIDYDERVGARGPVGVGPDVTAGESLVGLARLHGPSRAVVRA